MATPSSASELELGSGTVPEPLGPPVLLDELLLDELLLDPLAASPVAEQPFPGAPLDCTQISVANRKLFESAVLMKLAVVSFLVLFDRGISVWLAR